MQYSSVTQSNLETFFEDDFKSLKKNIDYSHLGKSFIWSHRVLLDKIFCFLDEEHQEMFPYDLYSLLFDILFVFSEEKKLIRPCNKKVQRFPQFIAIFERYLTDHFKFERVHEALMALLEKFRKYLAT